MEGRIDERGLPVIDIDFGGRTWTAMIDTGFNGFLELPEVMRFALDPVFLASVPSTLAGGHVVTEDGYQVDFPFDGELVRAVAMFAPVDEILIGTRMLDNYRLTIDFPESRVWLERE